MSNRTTTTTVIRSEKNGAGEWQEWEKTVTTVVERDDEGYPYGPINPFVARTRPHFDWRKSGPINDYMAWYDSLGFRPAAKKKETEQEDGQDG